VRGIASTVEQGDVAAPRCLEKGVLSVQVLIELGAIAALELVPFGGVVPKPATQVCAGSHFLQPTFYQQVLFAHAAWPEAFDEKTWTIVRRRRGIDTLDPDHGLLLGNEPDLGDRNCTPSLPREASAHIRHMADWTIARWMIPSPPLQ
jgi:hypothetical protein